MARIPRLTLLNSITGFKSANLLGTANAAGLSNLAMFSSAVHLGSDPALIGVVVRPVVADGKTSRHSYQNIRATGHFTLNHVHPGILRQAHQCSASYPDGVSEFEATGLRPQYTAACPAPYVAESTVKMGLRYAEEYHIAANQTILVVGELIELMLPENCLDTDGNLDLQAAGTLALCGLDSYHTTALLERLPYARVAG